MQNPEKSDHLRRSREAHIKLWNRPEEDIKREEPVNNPICRLLSFKVYNAKKLGTYRYMDNKEFIIQMFAIDEEGKSYSIKVTDFQPFFYVRVANTWGVTKKKKFISHVKMLLRQEELGRKYDDFKKGRKAFIKPKLEENEEKEEYIYRNKQHYKSYYEHSIVGCKIIKRKKLYGFDAEKDHRFILMKFQNTSAMHKVKNLWYDHVKDPTSLFGTKSILKPFRALGVKTELYEAKLPPLLRYFHMKEISPSGWIELPRKKIKEWEETNTNCDYEYTIGYRDIIPLTQKETAVPVKVCSFDIEAGSSHGDFPMAKKSYRKWVNDVITYWGKRRNELRRVAKSEQESLLKKMLLTAFGFASIEGIHKIYPKWDKSIISKAKLMERFQPFLKEDLYKIIVGDWNGKRRTKKKNEKYMSFRRKDEDDEDEDFNDIYEYKHFIKRNMTFLDYLNNDKMDKLKKLEVLDEALEYVPKCRYNLVPIKGDPVTFIGSTFMKAGDSRSYLTHGVCLGECDQTMIENARCETECYSNERDLLLAWTQMIRREKPDVMIGYNIFGFDWKFLCERAEETQCYEDFVQLARNNGAKCAKVKKSIRIASGFHELTYIDIGGIIQIDLYNYFRREVNLPSYKLQDVGSHFIGDTVKKVEYANGKTTIYSGNLMGLQVGNYVCFELISHSSDSYQGGKKFKVLRLDRQKSHYEVEGIIEPEAGKKLRWGLGKDDISPADLFKAFSETGTRTDKTEIAKYCFQDCNLVHHLFRKNDVWTGMTEQAAICSIPIDYVVMRGQGIKLLSFIAKKCRMKKTLMPVIQKVDNDGSYEGAICLKPKRGFYGEGDPVAVVDYASLYPSSMISENISHDSKVWTIEYDLDGKELRRTGIQNKSGKFIYDNLPNYEYVDIEYDRYEWISPDGKKKEVKVKVGTKKCRFAQFPDGKKAIMPAILQGLLAARKATRVKGKYKTILTRDGEEFSGLLSEDETTYTVIDVRLENEKLKKIPTVIKKSNVETIRDTYNSFMKNVFNQRQGAIKIVANSLYGQCGGRTSSFYEKDIAAATTATGRKLLLYGQRVIEEVYGDCICDTKKYGRVHCNAEYIYGDTDSVFFTFHLKELDGTPIVGKKGLEITIELAREAGMMASKFLKPPHDLEYEKTFFPFLLLSKKRYVGLLYETDTEKCKRKSMGIVLKRRDNAPIVKDGYGGIIDILMNEQNIVKAVKFIKNFLRDMVGEKFPLEKLIISKSLRGFYKNPDSIAHRVLADRMGQRDPGNKPAVGSRIPYVYIQTKKKVKLQGNRIEHPDYIRAHNIPPDYGFYITNQIMKPVMQIFALLLEQTPSFKIHLGRFQRRLKYIEGKYRDNEAKCDSEEIKLRNKYAKKLIFANAIRQANNIKIGQRTITSFF